MVEFSVKDGDMIACGPSACEECNRCESVFVDCEICELAEVTILKASRPKKEVRREEH